MRKITLSAAAITSLAASPVLAASGPFVSLGNTNFVVLVAFLVFLVVLLYFKVPSMLGGLLDKRAVDIKSELDEARAIHEEAREIYASFERKTREVQEQADRIVATAKADAELSSEQAKVDLEASIARRLAAAVEQIASAEKAAIKEVRDSAVGVAIAAAGDAISSSLKDGDQSKMVDDAIASVGAKLH